jgi:hypothetical protein
MNRKVFFYLSLSVIMLFAVSFASAIESNKNAAKDVVGSNFNWDVVFSVQDVGVEFMYTPAETSGASYHCTPTNPEPAVDSENVDYENVTLSWDCTDGSTQGVSYLVYLGTDNRIIPGVADENKNDTHVTIDRLLPSTKYYWTVRSAYNNQYNQPEEFWTFTTKKGKLPPYIKLAGYGFTDISEANGGTLYIYALCEDVDGSVANVKVYYQGNDTGLSLTDKDGDGLWDFALPGVPAGIPKGTEFVIELVATDNEGNTSDRWPYINVHSDFPKMATSSYDVIPWLDNRIDSSDYSKVYDFTLNNATATKIMTKAISGFPQTQSTNPLILAGGYWNSYMAAGQYSMLNITAFILKGTSNISKAEVFENMTTSTPLMYDDGSNTVAVKLNDSKQQGDQTAGDNLWTFMGGFNYDNPDQIKLGIVATDASNKKSDMFPKVIIH